MSDLISRSALLATYKNWLPQLARPEDAGDRNGVETCIAVLADAPAVDAELVRHGKWDSFGVRTTDHKGRKRIEYRFNACTLCSEAAVMRTAYCPNCGAKMDAEVEG